MPKIQWTNLPPALRDHLFNRLRERKITVEDLYQLTLWRDSDPEAPHGEWCKDFGSFKLCGEGKYPKTFLLRGQIVKGKTRRPFCFVVRLQRVRNLELEVAAPYSTHHPVWLINTMPAASVWPVRSR